MSLIGKFGQIFGANSKPQSFNVINTSREAAEKDRERRLCELANKAYAYYKNDVLSIEYFLLAYLTTVLSAKSIQQMRLVYVNYVPKIVKRLCMAYKNPPKITFTDELTDTNYQLVRQKIDVSRKEFHRLAK